MMNLHPTESGSIGIEAVLADTFAAHEDQAPDPADALDRLTAALASRSRRSYARPLAAAACVVFAAGIALAAVQMGRPGHAARHGNGGPSQMLAGESATSNAPRSSSSVPSIMMPFDLSWLPAGKVVYGARRLNVAGVGDSSAPSFDGEYLLTVLGRDSLDIDVQQMPGGLPGNGFKSGAGRAIAIHGRPGFESIHAGGPSGYEIYFETPSGLTYVNVTAHLGSTASAARLTAVGRHVARAVRLPGRTQVAPDFGIGHVPAGMKVNAFDIENTRFLFHVESTPRYVTSYQIGPSTSQDQPFQVTEAPSAPRGRPGRDVQGHPTRVSDRDGYRTLRVLDALPGRAVVITAPRPLAQLYAIADGLALPA